MALAIPLRVLRPLWYQRERYDVDAQLDVPPLDAAELIASGRARLAHPRDADQVERAAIAARDAILRALRADERRWVRRAA